MKRFITLATAVTLITIPLNNGLHAQGHAYHDGQNAIVPTEWAFGGLLVLSIAILLLAKGSASHSNP